MNWLRVLLDGRTEGAMDGPTDGPTEWGVESRSRRLKKQEQKQNNHDQRLIAIRHLQHGCIQYVIPNMSPSPPICSF